MDDVEGRSYDKKGDGKGRNTTDEVKGRVRVGRKKGRRKVRGGR